MNKEGVMMSSTDQEPKKTKPGKKTLFVIVLLVIIFIASVFVIKNKNIDIKNIKGIQVQGLVIQGFAQKPSYDQLLSIALKHPQVQAFVAGKQYTTNVKAVSEEDIDEMPVLFSGLSGNGELYMIDFRANDEGLKVVMDDEEVKKVFPITYMSVS